MLTLPRIILVVGFASCGFAMLWHKLESANPPAPVEVAARGFWETYQATEWDLHGLERGQAPRPLLTDAHKRLTAGMQDAPTLEDFQRRELDWIDQHCRRSAGEWIIAVAVLGVEQNDNEATANVAIKFGRPADRFDPAAVDAVREEVIRTRLLQRGDVWVVVQHREE